MRGFICGGFCWRLGGLGRGGGGGWGVEWEEEVSFWRGEWKSGRGEMVMFR